MPIQLLDLYTPLSTRAVEDVLYISGFASIEKIDRENEVVSPFEFDLATFMNCPQLLVNHQYVRGEDGADRAVGNVEKAVPAFIAGENPSDPSEWIVKSLLDAEFVSFWPKNKSPKITVGDKGLFVVAKVTHKPTIRQIVDKEIGGFSWVGYSYQEKDPAGFTKLKAVDLIEISVVNGPAMSQSTLAITDDQHPLLFKDVDLSKYDIYKVGFSKTAYKLEDVRRYTKSLKLQASVSENDSEFFLDVCGTDTLDSANSIAIHIADKCLIAAPKLVSKDLEEPEKERYMPYKVHQSGECPASKPWGVVKEDGKVMGCHETEESAKAQMAALYASESKAVTTDWEEGMMVRASYGENMVIGMIEHIMLEGSLGIGSQYEVQATPENPALLLRVFIEQEGEWTETEYFVGVSSANAEVISEQMNEDYEKKVKNSKYASLDFKPPKGAQEEAAKGLEWRREYSRGGTEVGVARARDLSNGKSLSPQTVRRMKAYFDRHEVDKKGQGWSANQDGYPSAGRIAWALWGGDAGRSWANALVRRMNALDNADSRAKKTISFVSQIGNLQSTVIEEYEMDNSIPQETEVTQVDNTEVQKLYIMDIESFLSKNPNASILKQKSTLLGDVPVEIHSIELSFEDLLEGNNPVQEAETEEPEVTEETTEEPAEEEATEEVAEPEAVAVTEEVSQEAEVTEPEQKESSDDSLAKVQETLQLLAQLQEQSLARQAELESRISELSNVDALKEELKLEISKALTVFEDSQKKNEEQRKSISKQLEAFNSVVPDQNPRAEKVESSKSVSSAAFNVFDYFGQVKEKT